MSSIEHDIVAGVLTGILSVFLIVYAFQPNRPYPSWMLEPAEKPWMFFVILVGIVYLFQWDYMIGILASLFVLALVFDMVLLTRHFTDNEKAEPLFTPSIDMVSSMDTQEQFDLLQNRPRILNTEDQVSKKWTVNLSPDPYDLRRNTQVDGNDTVTDVYVSRSGKPIYDPSLESKVYYPIFSASG